MTTPDNVTQNATMPSREFLVRQAVLNAAAEMFPISAREGRLARAIESMDYDNWPGGSPDGSILFRNARTEFRTLTSRFRGGAEVVELINHAFAKPGALR